MLEVMVNVGSELVRIYLDVANPWPVHEDVVEAVARMAPLTAAVDVKDLYVESRWAANHWHRKGFDVIYTWPGQGILPWQRIWHALGENLPRIGVPLVIEGLSEDADPSVGIKECVAFMQALDGPTLHLLPSSD
jgi:sugar phosphate isomerase/epimerase